ncbi:uncharacterized protein LOC135103549 isoform X2 [Scylla paramamosain]|uniref:uncharacterized protein LOC135103549 isoform X2 n=1 Tax=Scylla paramamosain TaxID=85552 RepID=UPI0030828942
MVRWSSERAAATLAVVAVVVLHLHTTTGAFPWLRSSPPPPRCELRHWVWYERKIVNATQLKIEYVPLEAVPCLTAVTTTLVYPYYDTYTRSVTKQPEVIKITSTEIIIVTMPLPRIVHVNTTLIITRTEVEMVTATSARVTTTTATTRTTWLTHHRTLPAPIHTSLVVVEKLVEAEEEDDYEYGLYYSGGLQFTPPSDSGHTAKNSNHSDY